MARHNAHQTKTSKTTTAYLAPELVEELRHRLSRIEGHVRGVKRMLDEQAECDDLLVQLSAVRAAVNQATIRLLEGHMDSCISQCVTDGDGEETIGNLKRTLAQVLKNS